MTIPGLWTACPQPRPDATLRFYCFPYAGGGVPIYARWAADLPEAVELRIVQLPGRGVRLEEPPVTDFSILIKAMTDALNVQLQQPFVFFGHSLGALISFELARALRRDYGQEPRSLFVSACAAPGCITHGSPIHNLPESAFIAALKRYNGLPIEVLEHEELLEVLLPTLRADFALSENYEYHGGSPFFCPIYAFGGREDDTVSTEAMAAWEKFTTGAFEMQLFPGDHFFINSERQALVAVLKRELEQQLATL